MATILYKKQHICLSPYQLTVKRIDAKAPASSIRELAFIGWDEEAAFIMANLSDDRKWHELNEMFLVT